MGILLVLIVFVIPPIFLTIYNFIGLFSIAKYKKRRNLAWGVTIAAGILYTYLYLGLSFRIKIEAIWKEQLYNSELHQPIWTDSWITICVLSIIGIIGMIVLIATDVNRVPPLVTVFGMAATYLFLIVMIIWAVQISAHIDETFPCLLLPINVVFITISLFREKIMQWTSSRSHVYGYGKNPLINILNANLLDAQLWPLYGLIFMAPVLGVVLMILVLFGQAPDAVITAWTETANWTLSGHEGPQNLYMDEHYLCTVAAGGHKKIVKPVRKGIRHGHEVIVNRQLMIANAFENVLEEKTPRLHRCVRDFYDKYGFPVADYIRHNKVACDITYFVMKPLEWFFLIVLYLVDVNPENRIAVQYLPGVYHKK